MAVQGTHFHFTLRGCSAELSPKKGFTLSKIYDVAKRTGLKLGCSSMYPNEEGGTNFHLDIGRSYIAGTIYPEDGTVVGGITVSHKPREARKFRSLAKKIAKTFKPEEITFTESKW